MDISITLPTVRLKKRYIWVLVFVIAVSTIASTRDRVWFFWWETQGQQVFSEDERGQLDSCDAMVWSTVAGVLQQDLTLPCGEQQFNRRALILLTPRKARWLAIIAEDPARSLRSRVRASLVLWRRGVPYPSALSVWMRHGSIDKKSQDDWWEWLSKSDSELLWLDPMSMAQVAYSRFASDPRNGFAAVSTDLSYRAQMPISIDVESDWEALLEVLELDRQLVIDAGDVHAGQGVTRGIPLEQLALARELSRWCGSEVDDRCIKRTLSVVEEWLQLDVVAPEPTIWTSHLAWFSKEGVQSFETTLQQISDWVRLADGEQAKTERIRAYFMPDRLDMVQVSHTNIPVGDPRATFHGENALPWNTAFAVSLIGKKSEVPVSVTVDEIGIHILLPGGELLYPVCGEPTVDSDVPSAPLGLDELQLFALSELWGIQPDHLRSSELLPLGLYLSFQISDIPAEISHAQTDSASNTLAQTLRKSVDRRSLTASVGGFEAKNAICSMKNRRWVH